jgi:hypothetical protein
MPKCPNAHRERSSMRALRINIDDTFHYQLKMHCIGQKTTVAEYVKGLIEKDMSAPVSYLPEPVTKEETAKSIPAPVKVDISIIDRNRRIQPSVKHSIG